MTTFRSEGVRCTSCNTTHPQTYVGLNVIECHGSTRCVHYVGPDPEPTIDPVHYLARFVATVIGDVTYGRGHSDPWAEVHAFPQCLLKENLDVVERRKRRDPSIVADIEQRLREGRAARERYEAAKASGAAVALRYVTKITVHVPELSPEENDRLGRELLHATSQTPERIPVTLSFNAWRDMEYGRVVDVSGLGAR